MQRFYMILSLLLLVFWGSFAQGPVLVGYWQNWNNAASPYIPLDQIDDRYSVVNISFATAKAGSNADMEFSPSQGSVTDLSLKIQTLQSKGKKVLISIGGGGSPVSIQNAQDLAAFNSSMANIITTYNFDGIDIDLEGSSLSVSGGTISNPVDAPVINLIQAIKTLMQQYHAFYHRHMILTFAPETAFVQGGMSAYGGIWGAYLPVLHALRDSLDLLHVQLYNSGSMYGIDGGIYSQGRADFIVSQTEAIVQGFNTNGGPFAGFPPSKIAVGLPACSSAGGGFIDAATVRSAVNYLLGKGPKPGSYTLRNSNGYPALRGMMTWSINWDALNTCQPSYEYAANYQSIFSPTTSLSSLNGYSDRHVFYPNPAETSIQMIAGWGKLRIVDALGRIVLEKNESEREDREIDVSQLVPGFYYLPIEKGAYPLVVKH